MLVSCTLSLLTDIKLASTLKTSSNSHSPLQSIKKLQYVKLKRIANIPKEQ